MGKENPVAMFTRDQMDALLYKAIETATPQGKRDRAIFLTAYVYMLRPSEVGLLRRSDVDAENGRIHVRRVKRSVGGEFELRPAVGDAVAVYLDTRDDRLGALFLSRNRKPISRQSLDLLMKRYGEAVGLPEAKRHFRMLRHTGVAHWTEASQGNRAAVQARIGHRHATSTHRYGDFTVEDEDEVCREAFASGKFALRPV